jgi:hypothetical protein
VACPTFFCKHILPYHPMNMLCASMFVISMQPNNNKKIWEAESSDSDDSHGRVVWDKTTLPTVQQQQQHKQVSVNVRQVDPNQRRQVVNTEQKSQSVSPSIGVFRLAQRTVVSPPPPPPHRVPNDVLRRRPPTRQHPASSSPPVAVRTVTGPLDTLQVHVAWLECMDAEEYVAARDLACILSHVFDAMSRGDRGVAILKSSLHDWTTYGAEYTRLCDRFGLQLDEKYAHIVVQPMRSPP